MSEQNLRKPLSKTRRFEVFKRDLFTCQYCGRRPPAVVLEVDHITPVVGGGGDDDHNLITACFDCNRGKGSGSLEASPIDIAERMRLLEERLEQTRAYEDLLSAEREREELLADLVAEIYMLAFPGWELTDRAYDSIKRFLRQLTVLEVQEAMKLAVRRAPVSGAAFKYFCGVCWRKIKGDFR